MANDQKPVNTASGNLQAEDSEVAATLRQRGNFAGQHLRTAATAARKVHEIEQANPDGEHGPWSDQLFVTVPVAVVMSAAGLEANVNEIIRDILGRNADGTGPSEDCPEDLRKPLVELFDEQDGNTIDRYKKLAKLLKKKPNSGLPPWQDADALVKFRHGLMHFRPAWDDEGESKLMKLLKDRKVPVYEPQRDLFPFCFMTYGCAKWSVQTALNFSADFAALISRPDKFKDWSPPADFSLP